MDIERLRARLGRLATRVGRVPRHVLSLFHDSDLPGPLASVAYRVRKDGLTYLSPAKLDKLGHAALRAEREGVEGAFLEAGCALGGSALLLAKAKDPARALRVYDVFGMIPPPTEEDGQDVHDRYEVIASGRSKGLRGKQYYGYAIDLYERVEDSFRAYDISVEGEHVELVKGRVEETLVVDGPVALAHVDVDWYQPVTTCLERIAPRLSVGGSIVLDDYFDWSGCRRATDAFLASTDLAFRRDESAGSLQLTRR